MSVLREEGMIDVPGGRCWHARLGGGDATPIVLLHGGPGAGHDYLLPLAEQLAETRPVVIYDQLGCGRSPAPHDPSLWTLDRAVAELDAVRAALGLTASMHLLGQSWGGWLAIEYLVRGASGVESVVLASTSASIHEFVAGADELIDELPEPHRTALQVHGAAGEHEHPDYLAGAEVFYHRHVCRLDPWPEAINRTVANMDGNQVYLTMNGPNEFAVVGSLRTWDRTTDLGRITIPTLVTVGRFDEIRQSCSETIARGIAGARVELFEHSAHCAHLEEVDRYSEVVNAFLAEVER